MKSLCKITLKTFAILLAVILVNGTYWLLSDIQQKTYDKSKTTELNLYEKCSVYSLHKGICTFGWFVSPESTRQQIWCTIPIDNTIVRRSEYFSNDKKIRSLVAKNPNATKNNPMYVAWKPGDNQFGLYSAYNRDNMRIALACNGLFLYKEEGHWVLSPKNELYVYPNLSKPTIIGPFKFHEGLIRYLQDIGWLHKPKIKWQLDIE
jgi:hypothetical protein